MRHLEHEAPSRGAGRRPALGRAVRPRLLAATALLIASCGWHTGLVPPEQAHTVGIEIFFTGENVLERDLEPLLHQELSRAVSDLVDASLVSVGDADLVLRGRILGYRRRGGVRNSDHELIESGVLVSASAELIDPTTQRTVRPAVRASLWSGYVLGENDAESAARGRVLRNIAETLVLDLFRPRRDVDAEANTAQESG